MSLKPNRIVTNRLRTWTFKSFTTCFPFLNKQTNKKLLSLQSLNALVGSYLMKAEYYVN